MGCRHYSLYALTVKPSTKLEKRVREEKWTLPTEDSLLEMMRINEEETQV
jgi:coproporphyrinogen III oxidase-like Fe-S oxidoreductase